MNSINASQELLALGFSDLIGCWFQIYPVRAVLSLAPVYRNIKCYPSAVKRNDMLMIRCDASIFFANTASFKTRIKNRIGSFLAENSYPKPCCFSGVNDVDFTGIEMMEQFFVELNEKESHSKTRQNN